jgi:hypothetical protein
MPPSLFPRVFSFFPFHGNLSACFPQLPYPELRGCKPKDAEAAKYHLK